MTAAVSVRKVSSRIERRDWLDLPARLLAGDPHWIAPLRLVESQRISRRRNPFFAFGEAELFVAYRGDTPVGRISAQINRRHLEIHGDETGHFGFFDCADDRPAARALVGQARDWLRARGMKRMLGPCSFSINEDIGLLVSGFDTRPAIMSSHAQPHAASLLDSCSLSKAMDLLAFRMKPTKLPDTIQRLSTLARQSPRVVSRQIDMANFAREIRIIFDIFNDAWSENWGFVPFSEAEITHLAKETKPLMQGKFARIVEIDGAPAAMIVVLPDINEVIAPFAGRLLPFNWLTLLRAVRADRWKTARVPLMGIRKAYRRTPLAAAVLSLMVADIVDLGRAYDLDWVEFSWILETNRAMVSIAEAAAGPSCRTYRVFEGAL